MVNVVWTIDGGINGEKIVIGDDGAYRVSGMLCEEWVVFRKRGSIVYDEWVEYYSQ